MFKPMSETQLAAYEALARAPYDDDWKERYERSFPECASDAIEELVTEVRRLTSMIARQTS